MMNSATRASVISKIGLFLAAASLILLSGAPAYGVSDFAKGDRLAVRPASACPAGLSDVSGKDCIEAVASTPSPGCIGRTITVESRPAGKNLSVLIRLPVTSLAAR